MSEHDEQLHLSGEDAQTFKGHNDLVTRDPEAMEHAPQAAAYAGAARATLSATPIPTLSTGLGTVAVPEGPHHRNPGYTPPSQKAPAHQHESSSDLPEGAPEQAYLDSLK